MKKILINVSVMLCFEAEDELEPEFLDLYVSESGRAILRDWKSFSIDGKRARLNPARFVEVGGHTVLSDFETIMVHAYPGGDFEHDFSGTLLQGPDDNGMCLVEDLDCDLYSVPYSQISSD
jgi:hypothetical protein